MPNPITENEVYQALGLTPPEPQAAPGANEQEPAQPAQTQEPAADPGANEQEPAQPAQTAEPTAPEGGENPEGAASEPQEPGEQSPEERRANAARRRQEEQQRAVDAAVQNALKREKEKTDAEWTAFFTASGLKNSITGEPIRTRADYDAWQQSYQAQQVQQKLAKGELTPEIMQQLISQNPVVKQAQALLDADRNAREQARQQEEQNRIQEELAQIGQLDPKVKTMEDLLKIENFDGFKGYVDKGYTFVDAYRLSHMEQITARRAQQAQQAAQAMARGKEHLHASGNAQGTGLVSVPPDVMRSYRLFNPKATDAEIQAHYNKNIKK